MLLKFFKSNLPHIIIFIPILGAILWLPSLYPELSMKQIELVAPQSTFFNWITSYLQSNYYLNISSALVICVLQSYLLIRLNFKYIFIDSKTYLPAILFILVSSSIYAYQNLNPALLANLAILIALDRCYKIEKDRNQFKHYFEGGLFVGIATLIYPIAFYFIIIIWLTQIILRTFNWREWISSIIGLITPFAFALAIVYINSSATYHINSYLEFFNTNTILKQDFNTLNLIAIITFVGIFIIALFSALRLIGTKKISTRKYFSLFLWILLLTSAAFTLIPSAGFELVFFAASPVAIIFTMFFIEIRKKWLAEVFFTIIFFSIFILLWV